MYVYLPIIIDCPNASSVVGDWRFIQQPTAGDLHEYACHWQSLPRDS